MASIVARAGIVCEFCAVWDRDAGVLGEVGMFAVAVGEGERGGRDVLGYPVGVAGAAVEGGDEGGGVAQVGSWAGEAVGEEARGVDRVGEEGGC